MSFFPKDFEGAKSFQKCANLGNYCCNHLCLGCTASGYRCQLPIQQVGHEGRLAVKSYYKDSTKCVNALAVLVAYSMISAGHLPLVMPFLWLGILSIALLTAVSWHERSPESLKSEDDERSPQSLKSKDDVSIVALPRVISALVNAASASGH